jgi:hypothetical protein
MITDAIIQDKGNGIYFYQVRRGRKVLGTGLSRGYTYNEDKKELMTSGIGLAKRVYSKRCCVCLLFDSV